MEKVRKIPKSLENSTGPTPRETEIIPIKKGVWRTYDATDGLPGETHCLLQDRQGYLWIGTNAGLCRYDGTEFITYTTADGLVDNRLQALCEDHEGRLWIGGGERFPTKGGGLSCFDGKRFTNYTTAHGLPDNRVNALCADHHGRLWIGTGSGLSCFDGDDFTTYTTADGLTMAVYSICEDSQGKLWFGTHLGLVCFDGQSFMIYTAADGLLGHYSALCEDNQGRLWIGSGYSGQGVSCFDGQRFTTYTSDNGLVGKQNLVMAVCEDHQGRLWFGGWDGVSCFDGDRFINYSAADGLWSNGVFDIIEDREGQMWFAHHQLCGLSCFDENPVQLLTPQPATTWYVAQDKEGRIWFGDANDVYGVLLNTTSLEVEQRKLSFAMGIIGIMVDSSDHLWVSPFQDGLYCYDSANAAWQTADGEIVTEPCHFSAPDDPDNNNLCARLEAKDGAIWLGGQSAVYRVEPERLIDGESLEYIDQKRGRICLIEDHQGRIWFGGVGGVGLSCWAGGKLTIYTQEDGLFSDNITSLVEDEMGGIWVGTTHGFCRFDGELFINYGEEHGLKNLYHCSSVRDASGQLWFATRDGGIYRTDGKYFQQLTEADGLPSNHVVGLLPQSDGSMIICTTSGMVNYQPTATLPPQIEIREVVAGKIYRNPEELELTTTDANLLTVSYQGLSLATRRMRYSYILEGYEKEWRETWEQQVRYENLPIDEYTFKVRAINRDLVPSEAPATLKLKVIPDPRDVSIAIMRSELNHLRREVGVKYDFHDIIGQSEAIKEVQMRMERAIESSLNVVVLITGDTGTGKELVANAIHFNSSRKDKPKVPYNCAAIPRELGASTLFGHKKGAFTGADEDRIGLFEAAEGGTLILDEIGDMPLDVQSILLRVLEERRFQRVGEFNFRDVDVWIIAITNRNLEKEVEAGRFRQDLFYRLNEFPIHIPPLRERREDVPKLAEHFLTRYSEKSGREINGFAPGVLEMLQDYRWPGNVRELGNVIQLAADYAIYEGTSVIQPYHFPSQIIRGKPETQDIISEHLSYQESLDLFKRRLIEDALRESGGNRAEAARILGMHRPNLVALIKRLGIETDR